MKCPYCQHLVAESSLPGAVVNDVDGQPAEPSTGGGYLVGHEAAVIAICEQANRLIPSHKTLGRKVGINFSVQWMRCPNLECQQLLLRARRNLYSPFASGRSVVSGDVDYILTEEVIVFPRKPIPRPIDPLVPAIYSKPFHEACLILDDSPGMSAVLSRKILADLLENLGGYTAYTINEQIKGFIDDPKHPSSLKENLHYLREMADFAAHTKKDLATGEILNTSREEADWTLTVVESLFDYWIVGPERDKARRTEMAAKMDKAGQNPFPH